MSAPLVPEVGPDQIRAVQLQLLAERNRAVIKPACAAIGVVAASQWDAAFPVLLAWLLVIRFAITWINHRTCERVLAKGSRQALGEGLLTRLEWGMVVAGLSWGSFAWLLPDPLNATAAAQFLVVALIAIVGMMINVTAPTRGTLIGFMAGFWSQFGARLLLLEDAEIQALMLPGAIVYGSVLTSYGLRLHDQVRAGVVASLQNRELLAQITALHEREREQRNALALANGRLNEALETANRLASHDPLTDVLNRRAFIEITSRPSDPRTSSTDTTQAPTDAGDTLVLIDLDHFKRINDQHGHPVGDAVLRQAADTLRRHVRRDDRLARWGGEEFILLMPDTLPQDARALVERLRRELESRPLAAADAPSRSGQLSVTASFGIARLDRRLGLEAAVARADQALYRAKAEGRNRVCVDPA